MIGNILSHVADELNAYVCRHQGLSPDTPKVILSPIMNADGSMAVSDSNLVLVTLMDVRQDSATPNISNVQQKTASGIGYNVKAYTLNVNLYILFTMHFDADKTREALNYLSYVLQFFQVKSVFTKHNTPGMPKGLDKLEFSLETQDFQQKGYMWGLLGVKYMPFVLYKARALSIIDAEPEAFIPPITNTDTQVN